MTTLMLHRGPDDDGYYFNDDIGLGIRRLAIIDIEGGHQPILSEDGRYVVILNGEIYNYIELRQMLIRKGHVFKTDSDTEVIVHLFEEKGAECVSALNGMFAFTVWDNFRKELFVFRDRIGIKPLFYTSDSNSFVFCSDIRGITAVRPLKKDVDLSAFLSYLGFSYIPYPQSIFKDIYKLEPGHFLTITSTGQIKKEKYWDIENFETLNLSTEEDYQERILNMIRDSIRLQMRSDAPIGTFLSGGIDSSCVVALLSELVDQPVRTFSVGFQGGANELPYARVVAEKFRTNHSELYISENDVLPVISEIIHNLDEPLYDSAMIPSLMLSKMAVEKGVKVILNGTGGDEIFGGYNRYLPQRKMWQIVNSLPSNVRKLSGNLISLLDKQRGMVIADPILFFINSISGINFVFAKQFLKNKTHYEIMVNNISDVYSKFIPSNGKKAKRHQLMYLDLKNYLVGDVLSLLDKTTMAASLEGRVPLLDHRIVEMCFEIPDKIKFRNGQLKGVLRDTLKDIIPYEILHLPKAGFAGPLNHWINRSLKESMYEHLIESPISFYQEYLYMEVIKSALDNIEKNWRCSGTLFALYIFSLWYKVHIEGQGISVIRQD